MRVELRVPSLGESVKTATIARWLKQAGDTVLLDEPVVELDSDKASLEVPAPATGVLDAHLAPVGAEVAVGQVITAVIEGNVQRSSVPVTAPVALPPPAPVAAPPVAASPVAAPPVAAPPPAVPEVAAAPPAASPAVRRALRDAGLTPDALAAAGLHGRVQRADVEAVATRRSAPPPAAHVAPAAVADEPVEIVPMSSLRRRIAERLLEAQQNAAILTTFNEIDMSAVLALRERHQDRFQKKYGIKLGFMGFFVKAAIEALKAFPSANAEIRGTDIVYKHYWHMGVAVSGPRGLVVPVLRHADRLSFAETEQAIASFGQRARDGALTVEDLQGGTFTISNGGIFGSLMSTPILNPPQVAILGMHAIQKRAVVVDDQIVIRPMMYVALSYDHRLLDGREAVSVLVRIKECVEAPERLLLEV